MFFKKFIKYLLLHTLSLRVSEALNYSGLKYLG
jgi:hypothetical protein